MLAEGWKRRIATSLFVLAVVSAVVAGYLKSFIVDHQAEWVGRKDLVSVILFGSNLRAPPVTCYAYVGACALGIALIGASILMTARRRP